LTGNDVEVAIHKLVTHYQLPAGARSEQRRLDGLRTRALEDAFRVAVHRAGIDEGAELCIRNLFVPVRLRLNRTDGAITGTWSKDLTEEISRVLHHGPKTNVVIYHSRRQALVDMALGVVRRDLRRAWAWRQLGLWERSHPVSDAEAVNELVKALQRTPPMVIPTLNAVASFGWLDSISARFNWDHWEGLGRAVLQEVRVAGLPDAFESPPSARTVREARQVLNKSRLLGAVTSAALSGMNENARRALAVLAIMDFDPGLMCRQTAGILVNLIAKSISSSPAKGETEFDEPHFDEPPDLKSATPTAGPVVDAARPPAIQLSSSPHTATSNHEAFQSGLRPDEAQTAETLKTVTDQVWPKEFPEAKTDPVDLRRRAISRFAGLLYLLAVVQDLDLPEQIATNELLTARPLVWVLHQLAGLLAPLEAHDPAALAFAGLSPAAKPPSEDEGPVSARETGELRALADRIVTRLAALVEVDELTDISLLEFVTRRRGEFVADAGWIEVRFSLDDVATEIRRAGLDLNPGYVPWLGVVVMFVYE
jgi:hypothetical protein